MTSNYSLSIYLAGPFHKQEYLRGIRDQLEKDHDYTITSRWLDIESGLDVEKDDLFRGVCASVDLADIDRADGLIGWTNGAKGTGGRHVEMGYALAKGKRVVIIGKHENIFHYHPNVTVVHNLTEAISVLTPFSSMNLFDAVRT